MWTYRCCACSRPHPRDHADYCTACGSPVLASPEQVSAAALTQPASGIWRYAPHVPVREEEAWLGVSEGRAALVRSVDLADRFGVREVWLVLDYLGPTGSFKDRAAAVALAHAVEHQATGVVCASSGNASASAAAYAARARLPAVIVVPENTPPVKVAMAATCGAVVLRVKGDYSNSFALARELCARLGLTNVASTYINPTAVAGLRSVAFDLATHLGVDGLDRVIVPTGAGALVHGVAAGYRYLRSTDEATKLPRVDVVQPTGCAPVVRAFDKGVRNVEPWGEVTTQISGLGDPLRGYAADGTHTLSEVRRSAGVAVAVDDAPAMAAADELATQHGILAEPAAAVTVAALAVMADHGHLSRDERIACLLTGHGLKTAATSQTTGPSGTLVESVDDAVGLIHDRGLLRSRSAPECSAGT
jgi:threonine synthase